ncbi:transporter substrate-binding domain-containing protein [Paraneptunicella aestuarii]|uniref:substrate-binding periplasmic protein n=1 Tax=Paraneptunicella aestuarii TaxID=2831148 RepID=UPI001E2C9BD4|nr:transporter substrate-binding domain-containing protein [Paraneptunicella aestuarii]UAA39180.1 transporter substrate-binding domain-containing protein [Paraneptunicella aestuarii]
MFKIIALLFLYLSVYFLPQNSAEAKPQNIPVYIYHLKPPLVVSAHEKTGVYYDIERYLNSHIAEYKFETVYIPRKRIDLMLEQKKLDGIVLGVNPVWFQDKDEDKYLWTARVLTDRDEIISLRDTPIEYFDLDSLKGKIVGGVRGFYYHGINELVNDGAIKRVNTASELDLFDLLLAKRIDFAVISRSTFDYIIGKQKRHMYFHLSKKPHDIFDRRILVPHSRKDVFEVVAPVIDHMAFDPEWQKLEKQYR